MLVLVLASLVKTWLYTEGPKLFVRKQKYGILECLSGHTIFILSGISLKRCVLAKTNKIFPFLEFIKSHLKFTNYQSCDQFVSNSILPQSWQKK